MRHVLVETNWVVGYAAPEHHRIPSAGALVEAARRGECTVHVPALCLSEARRTIQKFQPRNEADAIRKFLQRSAAVAAPDADVVRAVLDRYEGTIRNELRHLDATLASIRALEGVEVFALNDEMLDRSIDLSIGELSHLRAFDQAVLAAILVRGEGLRERGDTEVAFCELDSDLQPWDKDGQPKPALQQCYSAAGVWVYSDFELSGPTRPASWPP